MKYLEEYGRIRLIEKTKNNVQHFCWTFLFTITPNIYSYRGDSLLRLYSRTPIEQWLELFYKEHHILSPEDLNINKIADTLNICIKESPGPDRAIWDDEHNVAIIFYIKIIQLLKKEKFSFMSFVTLFVTVALKKICIVKNSP